MLRVGKDEDLKNGTMIFTSDMEEPLEVKNVVKDLGILVDDKAKFKQQRVHW